jgi:hypothetical protein
MHKRIFSGVTKQYPTSVVDAVWRTVITGRPALSVKTASHSTGSVILLASAMWLLLMFPGTVFSQAAAHHTVTVVVQTITLLQINVGTVALNITGAGLIAGQNQMTATDQSTTLSWGTNSSLKKITVNTNLAVPIFALKVLALNPTVGTAAAQVTLSTVASDLIINIGRSSGSSSLQYTGVALASQGVGKDTHLITYTIQTQ